MGLFNTYKMRKIKKETDLFIINTLFKKCNSYSEFINYYNNFTLFLERNNIQSLRTKTTSLK